MAAFLGFCAFAADLDVKTIRVDTVEPPELLRDRRGKEIGHEKGMERHRQRLGQVQQDRGRLRHERLLGVRAGLRVQQAVGDRARSSTRVRAKGNTNFGVLYDTCHAHMCAVGRRPTSTGEKETLPGGELELLEKLKGKITHVHLIDSDGRLNEHNT